MNARKPRHPSFNILFFVGIANTFFIRLAYCGKTLYLEGMNKLITLEMQENIVLGLLDGENPDILSKRISCDLSLIHGVLASNVFSERVKEYLERDIRISGVIAFKKIKEIAQDDKISKATQLKANQWITEKSLELSKLGASDESPATMTQDQLARRLKALQDEAIKRAKPIDTGVLDNMME